MPVSHIEVPVLPRGLFASILALQQPGSCFQLYREGMLNVTGLLKPVSCKALDLAVFNGFPTTFVKPN